MVMLAKENTRVPVHPKRRRRKKVTRNEDDDEDKLVDTDVTILNNASASNTTSLHETSTSVRRTPKAKRQRGAIQTKDSGGDDDEDDDGDGGGGGVMEQTRQRRKVRAPRRGTKQKTEVLELEDSSGWKSDKYAESANDPIKEDTSNLGKNRVKNGTGNLKYQNYNVEEGIAVKYSVDVEDVIESADVNHSASKFLCGPTMPSLRSKETPVVYIQKRTGQGFMNEDKNNLNNIASKQGKSSRVTIERPSDLDFFLKTHRIFQRVSLLLHGLLAGIAISHLVFVYSLSKGENEVLLRNYYELALPYHCLYYFLLAICCVSIFDRYVNISSGWSQFFSVLVRNPSRAFALIFYVFALIFSTGLAQLDNRISMYTCLPELWKNNVNEHLTMWKIVCVLRAFGCVLGWVMVCFAPNHDETGAYIKETKRKGEAELKGTNHQLNMLPHIPPNVVNWDGIKG